jgi:EmrB/QacA subfamily drug resistance transporter
MSNLTYGSSPPTTLADPTRWRSLAALLVSMFMVLLDTSIVTNALTTIQTDLNASYAQVQFVLSGYSVAYGILLITGSRLGDLFGRKRIFLLGLLSFTITSALCGMAWSPETLILFRILQGFAAALLFPQVSSFIQVLFAPQERSQAFGIQGAVIGISVVMGPLLGGLLIGANLFGTDWRPIFLVNIPVGIIGFFWALRILPESRLEQAKGLDIWSVLLVSTALFLLIYPITEGREVGWAWWVWVMLIASLVLLVVFVIYQNRIAARGGSPLVMLSLFRERAFAVGTIMSFLFQSSILAYFVVMTLLFQVGLGYTPATAALLLIAYQIAIVVGSLRSAGISKLWGRNVLLLGSGLLAVGLVATLFILRASALDYQGYELIPALLVCGFGFGCLAAQLQTQVLTRVNPIFAGSASGILSTVQQISSAFGVAIIGVMFFSQLSSHANIASQKVLPQLEQRLADLPKAATEAIKTQFQTCFADRSSQSDPSRIPPSCSAQNNLPASVASLVESATAEAATSAQKSNFLEAALFALLYPLMMYVLLFLMTFFMPKQANLSTPTGRAT